MTIYKTRILNQLGLYCRTISKLHSFSRITFPPLIIELFTVMRNYTEK